MRRPTSLLGSGALAGILAATALAGWFLVIDVAAGRPFHSPAFLFAVLSGSPVVEMEAGEIALYTAFHYGAFVLVGMAVAWVAARLEAVPGVLLGFILGFLLFDLVFYGSLWTTGVNVVYALGWPEVLAGNVIAGVVLMGALSLLGTTTPVSWHELLDRHTIVKEGLIAGLLGAGAVAIWFLFIDAVSGRFLLTPGALGSVVLHGARGLDAVEISLLTVGGYTVFHVLAFVLTGLIAAALATEAEEIEAPVVFGAVMLFVTFEVFFIGMVAIIAQWLLAVIPWWSIFVANLIAAVVMGVYLWRHHPKLGRDLQDHPLEDDLVRDDGLVVRGDSVGVSGRR
ncbi:MAG: hypothetical protein ACRELV_10950 [Longimicrobiales bacterium]